MDLPKIKNSDLPPEIKAILGDQDAVFDSIVDPNDIVSIALSSDDMKKYYDERYATAMQLIEARNKLDEMQRQQRKINSTKQNNTDEIQRHNKRRKKNSKNSKKES
jgi:hypothetical protein|tara:strand:- start:10 stop:327 length:318 start_codon:yes stop_codon:yes gene_type:complete